MSGFFFPTAEDPVNEAFLYSTGCYSLVSALLSRKQISKMSLARNPKRGPRIPARQKNDLYKNRESILIRPPVSSLRDSNSNSDRL